MLAYTLVELLIVILIIAILATVAIPLFSESLDRQRVKVAAERIRADLGVARQHAIAENTTKSVVFEVGTDRYTLVGIPDPNGRPGDYTIELNKAGLNIEIVSVDFASINVVYFDAYGKAQAGGQINLASQGSTLVVVVEPTTGNAEVVE